MFKNTIFRRMTALVLTLALAAAAALPGLAVYPMPIQTASETEAVYLFNADTRKTILNQNAGQQQYQKQYRCRYQSATIRNYFFLRFYLPDEAFPHPFFRHRMV